MFRSNNSSRLIFSHFRPHPNRRVASNKYHATTTFLEAAGEVKSRKKHKTYETEATMKQSPMVNQLYTLNKYKRGGKRHTTALGDKSRMNIVSEKLCDDVIDRLRPSLHKHIGCDVIDINPGVGLFSSKLHDILKPRSHILMEPDDELYLRWLQPIIDSDEHSYNFIPASGIIWDNLRKLETSGCLPDQKRLPIGHPNLMKPNNTLLLVANLGYYPPKAYQGFNSVTALMLHQLITAIRSHSLFQGYGQIRMLLWMRDGEKKQVLPRCVAHRRKSTLEAEMHCESVTEVAGSADHISNTRREHQIDLQGACAVRDKMKAAGIATPRGRAGPLEIEANEMDGKNPAEFDLVTRRVWHDRLEQLEEGFRTGLFREYVDDVNIAAKSVGRPKKQVPKKQLQKHSNPVSGLPVPKSAGRDELRTPEFLQLRALRYRLSARKSQHSAKDTLIAEYDSIRDAYHNISRLSSSEAISAREHLLESGTEWMEKTNSLSNIMRAELINTVQDRTTFYQDPPVLQWDQRPYEPLVVQEEEFFPVEEMCLLDIVPKSTWSVFQGEKRADYDYFEMITTGLFISPTQSVQRGLAALAPGADEWIIPRCPSFTDLSQGGHPDVNNLIVRTMNLQMFKELFEAWRSWPFRPSKAEMMVRLGSQNISEGTRMSEELDDITFGE